MGAKLWVKVAAVVLGFAFTVYAAACDRQNNAAERAARKQELNPDSGVLIDGGAEAGALLPYEDRTAIFPDAPSRPPSCSVEDGVELATIVDFEGGAPAWYKFDDGTAPPGLGLLPLDTTVASTNPSWGLEAVRLEPERCGSEWALHVQGGPFSNWGGGLGSQYFKITGELAEDNDLESSDVNLYSPTAADRDDPSVVSGKGVNASGYKGVALWARRGQNSQSSFRLILNDKYTSNEAARLQYNRLQGLPAFQSVPQGGPYCGRIRACVPRGERCANGKVCNRWPENGEWYCYNPDQGDTVSPEETPRCDTTSCTSTNDVDCTIDGDEVTCYEASTVYSDPPETRDPLLVDALFEDKPCTRHAFSDNFQVAVCYDPETDPVPFNKNERCDNGWAAVVNVTNNWEFYRIPWSEFAQDDTLAVAPDFAVDAIFSIGIGFSQGPVDFYIDDISFYR